MTVHKNGSLLNADCETISVRIRTVGNATVGNATAGHQMWPNIIGTTLLFSKKTKYYSENALDSLNLTSVHNFQKAIKPRYG